MLPCLFLSLFIRIHRHVGLGEDDITINNLQGNSPVILDGDACTVTEDRINKFIYTDIW
jgi:hypothetical protein